MSSLGLKKDKTVKKDSKENEKQAEPALTVDDKPQKKKDKKETEKFAEPTATAEERSRKIKDKKESEETPASVEQDSAADKKDDKKNKEKKEKKEKKEEQGDKPKADEILKDNNDKDTKERERGKLEKSNDDEERQKKDERKTTEEEVDEIPEPKSELEMLGRMTKDPKRAQRATSNVFAIFKQSQIQEFKEAFTIIDQNHDGLIDANDLSAIFTQIGRELEHAVLVSMVEEAPGPLNFTMFLSLFGDKLKGTDSEEALLQAFMMFDDDRKGKIAESYMKDLLTNVGDQFSKDEIRQVWKEMPIDGGMLDYKRFVKLIKHGKEED